MKTYGLIVADNGSNLYITGAYDTRWNNDVLNPAFASLKASDFEVVQLGWKPSSTGAPAALRPERHPPLPQRRPFPGGGAIHGQRRQRRRPRRGR